MSFSCDIIYNSIYTMYKCSWTGWVIISFYPFILVIWGTHLNYGTFSVNDWFLFPLQARGGHLLVGVFSLWITAFNVLVSRSGMVTAASTGTAVPGSTVLFFLLSVIAGIRPFPWWVARFLARIFHLLWIQWLTCILISICLSVCSSHVHLSWISLFMCTTSVIFCPGYDSHW